MANLAIEWKAQLISPKIQESIESLERLYFCKVVSLTLQIETNP